MAVRENEALPGFRSFWEKSKRIAATQNLTFVQVEIDPLGGEPKTSKKGSKSRTRDVECKEDDSSRSESSEPANRRQQVYQAQRRHRHRKAEYAKSLEDEIAQLKYVDSLVRTDCEKIEYENTILKKYLIAAGLAPEIDISPLDAVPFSTVEHGEGSVNESIPASDFANDPARAKRLDFSGSGILNDPPVDPEIDDSGRARIEHCQELLLSNVKQFDDDEHEERKTWETLADLVLNEG